jgi:ribose transport system substrate-binding protein
VMMVNEDQKQMGKMSAEFLMKEMGKKEGKILEVRGLPGNSVDRDRHVGFREVMEGGGNKFQIVEVVGNWDDGTAQKATADALAVHGKFDGVFTQGGSTGSVRAMIDAKHPFVPMAGEGENGFRKYIAQYNGQGLKGLSYGQSPGLVAISIKAAISALQGNPMPQLISIPIPVADYATLKDGVNFWSNLTDNFFTPNEFPPCGVNISATEIMAKDEKNSN